MDLQLLETEVGGSLSLEESATRPKPMLTAWLLLLLPVVALQLWLRISAPLSNTDTPRVMAMVAQDMDPSLYSRDLWMSPRTHVGYLPAYRLTLRFFSPPESVWVGMMRLFPLVLLLALIALWMVMREAGAGFWLTAALTLAASVVRDSGGGEYWGMTYQEEPLARYLYFGPALLALLPLARTWPKFDGRLALFTLAVLGALANLHPPSGLGLFLIVATLLLMCDAPLRRKLAVVAGGSLLALALVMPTAISSLQLMKGADAAKTAVTFADFAEQIVAEQSEVFPWAFTPLPGMRFMAGRNWLWPVLAAYLALLAVWLVWAFRGGPERRWSRRAWTLLLLLHLPVAFILTRCRAIDLCLVLFVTALCARREEKVSRLEWFAAAFLAALVALCWAGSAALRLAWEYGELRPLTYLMVNFSRFSRFVYLPLWLLAGIWAHRHARRETALPLVVLFTAFFFPWHRQPAWFLLIFAGALGTELCAHRRLPAWPAATVNALLTGAIALGLMSYGQGLSPWALRLPVAIAAAAVALAISLPRGAMRPVGWGIAVVVLLICAFRFAPRAREELAREKAWLRATFTMTQQEADTRALCDWARRETPKEALFHLSDAGYLGLQFRGLARRSILFTSKDGVSPNLFPPLPESDRKAPQEYFERPYRERSASLLALQAQRYGVDYVVMPADFPNLPESATVYHNETFRVAALRHR